MPSRLALPVPSSSSSVLQRPQSLRWQWMISWYWRCHLRKMMWNILSACLTLVVKDTSVVVTSLQGNRRLNFREAWWETSLETWSLTLAQPLETKAGRSGRRGKLSLCFAGRCCFEKRSLSVQGDWHWELSVATGYWRKWRKLLGPRAYTRSSETYPSWFHFLSGCPRGSTNAFLCCARVALRYNLCPRMLNWLHRCLRSGTTFGNRWRHLRWIQCARLIHPNVVHGTQWMQCVIDFVSMVRFWMQLWTRPLHLEEVAGVEATLQRECCRNKKESLFFFQCQNLPSAAETDAHESTHVPSNLWCKCDQMG